MKTIYCNRCKAVVNAFESLSYSKKRIGVKEISYFCSECGSFIHSQISLNEMKGE